MNKDKTVKNRGVTIPVGGKVLKEERCPVWHRGEWRKGWRVVYEDADGVVRWVRGLRPETSTLPVIRWESST